MPDHTNPETAATLHPCNVCVAVAHEIHTSLTSVNEFRHGATDQLVCGRMVNDYGLVIEKNTYTKGDKHRETESISLEWRSSKVAPTLARDEGITPMSEHCARIEDKHQKNILSDFRKYDLADFT